MSVSVKTYDFTMPANGACQIQAGGSYFRVQSATGAIKVNGDFGEASPLLQGQGLKDSPFSRLNLTNLTNADNSGSIIVAGDEFIDQQMVLSGSIKSSEAPLNTSIFTSTITNLNSQMIVGSNPSRRYLLIQNKSKTGTIWVTFGYLGSIGAGLMIPPLGYFEQSHGATFQYIGCIGDIASNPDVFVMEGI